MGLVGVVIDPQLPRASVSSPFSHKRGTAEQVTLNDHAIEAVHVLIRVNATKANLVWEHIKLHS